MPDEDVAGATITTYHDKHYDFKIVKETDVQEGAFVTAGNAEGEVSVRSEVDWPDNFTLTQVPQSYIEQELANRATVGKATTRKALIAELLRNAVYERHCQLAWITHIDSDDQELADYLNTVFETTGRTQVVDSAPVAAEPAVEAEVAPEEGE